MYSGEPRLSRTTSAPPRHRSRQAGSSLIELPRGSPRGKRSTTVRTPDERLWSVAEAIVLESQNQRVRTGVPEQVAEVRAARRRLLAASDDERRRLDVRLRGAAMRRLEAISADTVAGREAAAPNRTPWLREVQETFQETESDLSAMARGLWTERLTGHAFSISRLANPSGTESKWN
jgi:hypothetical protein